MRLHLGHWLLAGLLAVAFHAAILVGWRTPVSSMTATPRGPVVEMATSLAGIMGQAAQVAEMRPPETTREVEQPVEKVVDPPTPDAISDQMPFEVAATAPFVIPRELNAAEPLPMVTPTEVPVLEAMPPTLKPVQPKKTTVDEAKGIEGETSPKEDHGDEAQGIEGKTSPKEDHGDEAQGIEAETSPQGAQNQKSRKRKEGGQAATHPAGCNARQLKAWTGREGEESQAGQHVNRPLLRSQGPYPHSSPRARRRWLRYSGSHLRHLQFRTSTLCTNFQIQRKVEVGPAGACGCARLFSKATQRGQLRSAKLFDCDLVPVIPEPHKKQRRDGLLGGQTSPGSTPSRLHAGYA